MPRWLAPLLLALVAAALIAVVWLALENQTLRRELAALRATPVTVDTTASPPVVASASTTSTGEAASTPSAPAAPGAPAPVEREGRSRRDVDPRERAGEMFARALADPDARAALLSREKAQIDRTFGDYFVKLGLNEVQIETLRTLLAERRMARMEAGLLERTAETDQARAEAGAWREAKLASTEAEINGLLGAEGLKNLQAYADTAPQRQVVDDIARRANYAGAPLSNDASDRLLAAVRQASTDIPLPELPGRGRWNGGDGGGGGRREPVTQETVSTYLTDLRARNQQIIEQAKTFLTQPQLEALADQQIDEMQQTEAQLKFMLRNPDARGGPGGAFGPGGGRGPGG